MMKEMHAKLIAYVQPPGVMWVLHVGSSNLSDIYTRRPHDYRFAVVKRNDAYEVLDFWEMTMSKSGWLIPSPGDTYTTYEAAVAATVLLNQ